MKSSVKLVHLRFHSSCRVLLVYLFEKVALDPTYLRLQHDHPAS